MAPISGMMTSPTSEVTMAPNAAPMMTPTARSMTLPFMANSRNSLSIRMPFSSTALTKSSPDGACSVDQAGMRHRTAHGGAGRLRHRHHRQPQVLLQLAEQRHCVLDRRRVALDEEIVVQRHQLVV